MRPLVLLACAAWLSLPALSAPPPLVLYVSPVGSDRWSGRLANANAGRTDGPLATLSGARDALRRARLAAAGPIGPATVWVRGGSYRLAAPFVLAPEDSGTASAPVTYAAYRGERPVFSGGTVIGGWTKGPGRLWSARLPDAAAGRWTFQQLFVNGTRRTRARSPNRGFYTIVRKGQPLRDPATGKETARDRTAFTYHAGDIERWPDLADAQVEVFHSWETSRLRIADVDTENHLVTFTGPSFWPFQYWDSGQRYRVENVREALDEPGEWYLDRRTGTLLYWPMPGEDIRRARIVAPRLTRLLEIRGAPDAGKWVEHITLRGLSLQHEDWTLEPGGHSDTQAVVTAPAAVMADGARHCTFDSCEIAHVGDYGLWLRRGCKDCRVVHCRLFDLGVGGVRIGEAAMAATDDAESTGNVVDNCHIYDGGHVYPAGVGIWIAQSSGNRLSHNEIHDLAYTGISIGWNWDDAPNRCHHNVVEYNHVHHLVKGLLSDAGAIYTLGTSPGSIIRNNVFHDVWPYHTPPFGWGIYLDSTCSGYLVENNVVYNTLSGGLMYNNGGHEHVIRNNVFARSADYAMWPCWERRPSAFTRNIVYQTQGQLLVSLAGTSLAQRTAAKESLGDWDGNLYWDARGPARLRFLGRTFAQWQAMGLDAHSRVADPRFVDPAADDFRLKPGSPALALGFRPIDTSRVGLYGDPAWVAEGRRARHARTMLPAPPPPPRPVRIDDGFEGVPVGAAPEHAAVSGEEGGASVRVTDEQAAAGRHSLKFVDSAALPVSWQPHIYYQPHLTAGTVRESFDLRVEPRALMFTEWRDSTAYPQCVGPSVVCDGEGRVAAGGKVLTTVPVGRWFHVEIEAKLSKGPPGTYQVTVVHPDGRREVFPDIPVSGSAFHELHWLGFVSNATVDSTFYLDNVRIVPR